MTKTFLGLWIFLWALALTNVITADGSQALIAYIFNLVAVTVFLLFTLIEFFEKLSNKSILDNWSYVYAGVFALWLITISCTLHIQAWLT